MVNMHSRSAKISYFFSYINCFMVNMRSRTTNFNFFFSNIKHFNNADAFNKNVK